MGEKAKEKEEAEILARAKILDKWKVPVYMGARLGEYDTYVRYQVNGRGPYIPVIPKTSPTEKEIDEAIIKEETERLRSIGRVIEIR